MGSSPNGSAPAIVVALNGGLGNQLFQYAMGRALALRNGLPLVLDLAWFDQVKHEAGGLTTIREYALAPFALLVGTQRIGLAQPQAAGLVGRISRRLVRYIPRRQMGRPVYAERGFPFDPQAYALATPVYLQGYWQSPKYFDDIAALLRQELGQPRGVSAQTQQMLGVIASCDAICLHIRRGDYVTNRNAAATHGLCSLDYYSRGLEIIVDGLASPHCFVFSDDPAWARDNLQLPVPKTIVDINGPEAAHEDLWLMSACKGFVIANSSLSWWGAWLSERECKRVVAPAQWFSDASRDTRDLIPVDWIRI